MRMIKILLSDINFQYKYGFYYLYLFFTLLYIGIIKMLPIEFREITAKLLIYSDPAVIGLFFMGGIVLLEKSQRIFPALIISPIKFIHYFLSKILSLAIISTVSGVLIILFTTRGISFSAIITIFFSSMFFSTLGMLVALFSNTLNNFILLSALVQIIFSLPGVFYLFGISSNLIKFYPAISIIKGLGNDLSSTGVIVLWLVAIILILHKFMEKRYRKLGGEV